MTRWIRGWLAVFLLSLGVAAGVAHADGTFIAAANRTDMVFDQARNVIYIANGDRVLRYDVANQRLLTPIVLGGRLYGLDISPDGNTLAVGDASGMAPAAWVHLVNLVTLTDRKVTFPVDGTNIVGEFGTYSVAFTGDGGLLATSLFMGSGWVSMRRLDLATLQWTTLATVTQAKTGSGSLIP